MYGIGYGLGKMAEGLTGGTLQGLVTQYKMDQQKRSDDLRNRQLAVQERQLGLSEQNAATMEAYRKAQVESGLKEQEFKEYMDTSKMALDLAKAGNAEGAASIYNPVAKKYGKAEITSWDVSRPEDITVHFNDDSLAIVNKRTGAVQFEKNPNATPKYQSVTADKALIDPRSPDKPVWQGEAYGKPKGGTTLRPDQALKRISEIQKAKVELGKADVVTSLLATINPDLQVGQPLDEGSKQSLFDAWDQEEQYLRSFVPESRAGSGKPKQTTRTVIRTGTHNGRKVVQYSDGAIEYAD